MAANPKKTAGERAVEYVDDDMVVGLGTGSTAYFAIVRLADRIRLEGLRIQCIPTSERSATLARELEIPLTSFAEAHSVDVTIDGADEVDPAFNLIKGVEGRCCAKSSSPRQAAPS